MCRNKVPPGTCRMTLVLNLQRKNQSEEQRKVSERENDNSRQSRIAERQSLTDRHLPHSDQREDSDYLEHDCWQSFACRGQHNGSRQYDVPYSLKSTFNVQRFKIIKIGLRNLADLLKPIKSNSIDTPWVVYTINKDRIALCTHI